MGQSLDDRALDTLFREARTFTKWQPRPVTDATLRDVYDLLKWAPTSANGGPARFAFLRSREAKERLRPALAPLLLGLQLLAKHQVLRLEDQLLLLGPRLGDDPGRHDLGRLAAMAGNDAADDASNGHADDPADHPRDQ